MHVNNKSKNKAKYFNQTCITRNRIAHHEGVKK